MRFLVAFLLASASLSPVVRADEAYDRGREAILGLSGCFLVDYSFTEIESLMPGYIMDPRVYDASAQVAVKELIVATEDTSRNHIRLQHVLFAMKPDGTLGFVMKHQAEDWDYQPTGYYDFVGDARWEPRSLVLDSGMWVRRVTNLDDGLRYQCAAAWSFNREFPEWQCDSYAPIPGRETRDMGRRDYQALQRSSRIIAFPESWIERENNVKTIHQNGVRTPLAREFGKIWYVRQPDQACSNAAVFASERRSFWNLLESVWLEFLTGDSPWMERATIDGLPRYVNIGDVEDRYYLDLARGDPQAARAAAVEIREIINNYRVTK